MQRAFAGFLATALVATACSAGEPAEPAPTTSAAETTTTAAAAEFPVTVAADNGDVTIETRPERILSLSAAATEILFAIGAGDQVAAVDSFSTYPAEAPTDPDLMAIEPNIEAIVDDHDPDLVVLFFDPGEVEASFEALGIPVIVQLAPIDIDGIYPQVELLGAATGNDAGAAALVAGMQDEIDAIVAEYGDTAAGVTYYHELDDTLYTVTSTTFVGDVYDRLGMVNVADPADADGSAFGYPQLSAEFLVDADPDMVFLADTVCCGQSAATIAERPGWEALSAVPDAVVELDDDVASRPGPRVVDFLSAIADAVAARGVPG
jgi:iron complex transport system substrate-binding protein